MSYASDLGPADPGEEWDVYVDDLMSGAIALASVTAMAWMAATSTAASP